MVDESSADPRDKIMSSLDYSLQLLFLATQVDMTWNNSYSQNEEHKETEKPVTLKKKVAVEHVMLMPRLKKSFLSILKATKYKLANTCLPCIRQCSEESVVSDVSFSKKKQVSYSVNEDNIVVEGKDREEEKKTAINTIYKNDSLKTTQEKVLDSDLKQENSSVFLVQTIADGRQCFQESRKFASRGIDQVKSLSETVSSIQKNLQFALGQLCWVEYGLNDYRWESVDRETWTQSHFLSSVGTFTSLMPHARPKRALDASRLSLNSDISFSDLEYSWDD